MSDSNTTAKSDQQDDAPVWGISAIAREVHRGRNSTRHLLERGDLPGRRISDRWVSTRNQLRRALGVAES